MSSRIIPGIGSVSPEFESDLIQLETAGNGAFKAGADGVREIFTFADRKEEFIVFADKTLCYVKSAMGYPAYYPVPEVRFEGPAEAVLMDLDGTSVHSESFWMWVIEQATGKLLKDDSFRLSKEDEPHVSGHSVSEHLQYCINKYVPDASIAEAREHYFAITRHEMNEIMAGRGREGAFTPAPNLKEFLTTLKDNNVKIGLVTSGLYEKAWPEILDAFRTIGLGDPLEFYDAIISAGTQVGQGRAGTLGELSPKPHPWLYAETACVGLGIDPSKSHKVVGMEDSGAGLVSIRLSGFAAIGIGGGNIAGSGKHLLCDYAADTLMDSLPYILGQ
ncbi:HAD family hydrolase [Coraliomargarita parva]|uniref:HAD family hydrolase n=1 Tax=Coraliomargarita parva TaxID=3014050 RepID=UPI0022B33E98|nr:HAD hydrolase-like protein [Coraliomargarita parva]